MKKEVLNIFKKWLVEFKSYSATEDANVFVNYSGIFSDVDMLAIDHKSEFKRFINNK